MSSRFADLMALSASQTAQADKTAKSLLEEKRRKEEQRRREQEVREKKEREQHIRLVQKRLEEQQREKERKAKQDEERQQREELSRKREADQRNSLQYGSKGGRASSGSRDGGRTRKSREGSVDSIESGAMALTREEKRQRKLQSELNRSFSSRRGHVSGHSKTGKMFKDATIITTSTNPMDLAPAANSHLSVKERFMAMPMVLTKLNTQKRDTRTIDEILRDRQKAREAKVLDGEQAREFHDWFGDSKKSSSGSKKPTSTQSSVSPSPSRAITPNPSRSQRSKSPAHLSDSAAAPPRKGLASRPGTVSATNGSDNRTKEPVRKPSTRSIVDLKATSSSSKPLPKATSTSTSSKITTTTKSTVAGRIRPSSSLASSSVTKRQRSPSFSDSPPPPKRRPERLNRALRDDEETVSGTDIWAIMGMDRNRYVRSDVYSDEESDGMEVGADELRKEELRSARIAKREDELAEEEERCREEAKRRKRKEREILERRG